MGCIGFTTPKKRLVQFTQQSSYNVHLHCHYLSPKTPKCIHEAEQFLSNIYISKGAYCSPNQAPASQSRGEEMQNGRQFKRRPLTSTPTPTTHQKTQLEDKECQQHASHNDATTWPGRPKSHVLMWLIEWYWVNTVLPRYFSNKGTPLVKGKSQSNLNKFFYLL